MTVRVIDEAGDIPSETWEQMDAAAARLSSPVVGVKATADRKRNTVETLARGEFHLSIEVPPPLRFVFIAGRRQGKSLLARLLDPERNPTVEPPSTDRASDGPCAKGGEDGE